MEVRRFSSMREALEFLGIKPPRVTREMSQAAIDELVAAWKNNELQEHYKKARIEAHPDRHPNEVEAATTRFQDLGTAYEEIRANLKLRKAQLNPAEVTQCRWCYAARTPADASFCHDCGTAFLQSDPVTACMQCKSERLPVTAKFCHSCGYEYRELDSFVNRLLSDGLTRGTIERLTENGTIWRWRQLSPLSPVLREEIERQVNLQSSITAAFNHGGKRDKLVFR